MRQLLNTLYITTQGAYLHREGETVLVNVEQETRLQVPIRGLSGIVCFGRVSCSPFLMALCAETGVGLAFLTENGRFLARVQGPVSGNVVLRRGQYKWAEDPEKALPIASSVVLAKVANSRQNLVRALREYPDHPQSPALEFAVKRLASILDDVRSANSVDRVRGHEGDAARVYFSVFDHLIIAKKDDFFFRGRSRRPPLDNMNALLSFLYTLLTHDVVSALETVGLDPAVGYLHLDRPGRPSLALDLVEELRPILADRLALTLTNRKQISPSGFRQSETGGIVMDEDTRKEVIVAYQNRKKEEIVHPFLNERIPFGMLPYAGASLLARFIRGDLDGYPSFLWR
jgi:CRISPR-associated protein Cas1